MSFSKGDILLVELAFSTQAGLKRRPVVVLYDGGDDDLLIIPITTHPARTGYDVQISEWQRAGLRAPSVARIEKLATIAKSTVIRQLGQIVDDDFSHVRSTLDQLLQKILAT